MIKPNQLRDGVIVPVLQRVVALQHDQGGDQGAAVELLLGTAMQESACGQYIAQVHGPALGVWQMEPATETDLWTNFLAFRADLRVAVQSFVAQGIPRTQQLEGNLYYACAMARVEYFRAPDPLPAAGDIPAQAAYYVKYYNRGGSATVKEYLDNWQALQHELRGF